MPNNTTANQLFNREAYFTTADLSKAEVFCVDDRPSDKEAYLKVPGGLALFASLLAIMRFSSSKEELDMAKDIKDISKDLKGHGLNIGVHSDSSADRDKNLATKGFDASIGCGYIEKQSALLGLISDQSSSILETLTSLIPGSKSKSTLEEASKIIKTIKLLAASSTYLAKTPRQIARSALKSGAPFMIVDGHHSVASIGIINYRAGTVFKTSQASKDELPAYVYDAWTLKEIVGRSKLLAAYPFEKVELAALIEAIATFRLLGVKDIYVRF